jgi:subtilisin family serine protease
MMRWQLRRWIGALCLVWIVLAPMGAHTAPDTAGIAPTKLVSAQIAAELQQVGTTRVIVNLQPPGAALSAPGAPADPGLIAAAQDQVILALMSAAAASPPNAGDAASAGAVAMQFQVGYRYSHVPALVMLVDAAALALLQANPLVTSIEPDLPTEGHLMDSLPAINADDVHTLGFTGKGARVAVLDSGIRSAHPDLISSLIAQVCFTGGGIAGLGSCPPGNTNQGASAEDAHGHGTNVAGIIASDGTVAPRGFAPDAQIAAIRVLGNQASGYISDWVAGLNWIIANQPALQIDVVNMSLGSTALYSGSCQVEQAATHNAVQQLVHTYGVTVFASTGNSGSPTSLASPACLPDVIAVGATYDSSMGREPDSGTYSSMFGVACFDESTSVNVVACFSNSNAFLDIYAPGRRTTSTGLFSNASTYSGTSQAAPTAAGVAALLLEFNPFLTPADIEGLLESSGVPILDAKNGIQRPRIDALAALTAAGAMNMVQNGDFELASPYNNPNRDWTAYGAPSDDAIQWQTQAGVFEFFRNMGGAQAVVFQQSGLRLPVGAPVEISAMFGNSSATRKRAVILAHDSDFSDLQVCSFWLPAGQPLSSYRMLFETAEYWTNATLSVYASPETSEGFIRVDNVTLNYRPTQQFNAVICDDPNAPAPSAASDGANLISDGGFDAQTIGTAERAWGIYSTPNSDQPWLNMEYRFNGGLFEYYRKPRTDLPPGTSASAVVLQYTQNALPAGTILEAQFTLGNSSPDRARVTALIHTRSFIDLAVCTFWLPAGTPPGVHTMRAFTFLPWNYTTGDLNDATISFYAASAHNTGWLRLDDVSLRVRPTLTIAGTECYPAGVTAAGGAEVDFSLAPTLEPTATPAIVETPTDLPTATPDNASPVPTEEPTSAPTNTETPTDVPTDVPTETPTDAPITAPTEIPTETPSAPAGA